MSDVSMDIRLPPSGSQQYELEVTQNYEGSPWHVRIHSLEWDPAIDEDGRKPMVKHIGPAHGRRGEALIKHKTVLLAPSVLVVVLLLACSYAED